MTGEAMTNADINEADTLRMLESDVHVAQTYLQTIVKTWESHWEEVRVEKAVLVEEVYRAALWALDALAMTGCERCADMGRPWAIPVSSVRVSDGLQPVCADCLSTLVWCDHCGVVIDHDPVSTELSVYHRDCYDAMQEGE